MKKEKGFTLVELLAVITLLAVIMVIAGASVTKIRKDSSKKEAIQLENMLTEVGSNVYSYETISGTNEAGSFNALYQIGNPFIIKLDQLKGAGYLKDLTSDNKIPNPFGGVGCDGYILVDPSSDTIFKGYLNCGEDYTTSDFGVYQSATSATLSNS